MTSLSNLFFLRIPFGSAATKNYGLDAGELVELDAQGRLPAVDGSQLLNLPQAETAESVRDKLSSLTGSARLDSNAVKGVWFEQVTQQATSNQLLDLDYGGGGNYYAGVVNYIGTNSLADTYSNPFSGGAAAGRKITLNANNSQGNNIPTIEIGDRNLSTNSYFYGSTSYLDFKLNFENFRVAPRKLAVNYQKSLGTFTSVQVFTSTNGTDFTQVYTGAFPEPDVDGWKLIDLGITSTVTYQYLLVRFNQQNLYPSVIELELFGLIEDVNADQSYMLSSATDNKAARINVSGGGATADILINSQSSYRLGHTCVLYNASASVTLTLLGLPSVTIRGVTSITPETGIVLSNVSENLWVGIGISEIGAHTHGAEEILTGVINVARLGSGTANSTTFLRGDNTWVVPPVGAHEHNASELTSGTINPARLGSGTANSTTFLRGDNTWVAPSVGAPVAFENGVETITELSKLIVNGTGVSVSISGTEASLNITGGGSSGTATKIVLSGDYTLTDANSSEVWFDPNGVARNVIYGDRTTPITIWNLTGVQDINLKETAGGATQLSLSTTNGARGAQLRKLAANEFVLTVQPAGSDNWSAAVVSGAETLSTNRTYYVRPDGNDANTGLSNTSGGAFLTIPKLIDTVAKLNFNGYNVTGSVAAGTYSITTPIVLKDWIGAGNFTIEGAGATSIIDLTAVPSNTQACCILATTNTKTTVIKNFKLQVSTSAARNVNYFNALVYAAGAPVRLMGLDLGAINITSPYGGYLFCEQGGSIYLESSNFVLSGNYSNNGNSVIFVRIGGLVALNGSMAWSATSTRTFTNFMQVIAGHLQLWLDPTYGCNFSSLNPYFSGSSYSISAGGIVNTFGSYVSGLPGSGGSGTIY